MSQFYQRRSIDGTERDERYRLITEGDGSLCVEYEWLSSDGYGAETGSECIRIPVTEFLVGDYDEAAKAALRDLLSDR
jgi:hypothetical protein